jgi:Cu-Zn family superoxide dismutase
VLSELKNKIICQSINMNTINLYFFNYDIAMQYWFLIVIFLIITLAILVNSIWFKNRAKAVIKTDLLDGIVYFDEPIIGNTKIYGTLSSKLEDGEYGIHIHEFPAVGENCSTTGNHYNPYNSPHGDQKNNSNNRHIGDLGNVTSSNGIINISIRDPLIVLSGPVSVIGKSLVMHNHKDDLGLGHESDSLSNGHSGKRLCCAHISKC